MESGFRHLEIGTARRALGSFWRAVFPHECAGCGKEGEVLCDGCRESVMGPRKGLFACPACGTATPFGAPCGRRSCRAFPLDGLMASAPYGDRTLRTLLRLWKYERVADAGEVLVEALVRFIARHRAAAGPVLDGAEIVPVPLSFVRRAARGFNQSEALAAALAEVSGSRLRTDLLRRLPGRPAQAGIDDRAERRANVSGSFGAKGGVRAGGRYVLADDVATSSATLAECARILKRAGASSVWAVTLLRG